MAAFLKLKPDLVSAQPLRWLDDIEALLARELAPTSRKFRTAFRMTTVATHGAGLVTICHVHSELGTYIVWLLVGAGPLLSVRKAGGFLVAEALALVASVVMLHMQSLAEVPEIGLEGLGRASHSVDLPALLAVYQCSSLILTSGSPAAPV
jgi:hypothetical protein